MRGGHESVRGCAVKKGGGIGLLSVFGNNSSNLTETFDDRFFALGCLLLCASWCDLHGRSRNRAEC